MATRYVRIDSYAVIRLTAAAVCSALFIGCAGDMSVSEEVNSFATGDPFLAFTDAIHPYAVTSCAGCHSTSSASEGRRYPFATGPAGQAQSEASSFAAFEKIGLARFADRGSDGHGVPMPSGSAARAQFERALQRYMLVLEGRPFDVTPGILTVAKQIPTTLTAGTCTAPTDFSTTLTFDLATELRSAVPGVSGSVSIGVCRRATPAGYALRILTLSVPAGAASPVSIKGFMPVIDGRRESSWSTFATASGTAQPGGASPTALSASTATLSFDYTPVAAGGSPTLAFAIECLKSGAQGCAP